MKIRKIAAIMVLVFSSFAANSVAPTKAELEAMYSKAFRAFDSNNFPEALKQLDEIDARQSDVAESHNLRGVIQMRQGNYDQAEAALQEAVRIDPKFWNARFNLAEIPFLKKNWAEARDRFQKLLSSNVSDLEGDAAQLIQYKVLLTYLLEGKENMVDSILAKFELSAETPAAHYANAAIAFHRNNQNEAKDWIEKAEKNFSPQLNKLFAESLYEVGWMQKQAGQTRASMTVTTAAERAEKSKAFAHSRFEQAQQALQQRDLENASKLVDEADAADPNQPATQNLRGEILMEQQDYGQAESAFKKALKLDPKFREAQYNLAQIPFKKKDYTTARERFDSLLKQTSGGDKSQAAQILKYDIYLTYLLDGKDSRAQKIMEQFQFTGDTPALYYAQAAWEFKHNNPDKANDWIASARKIYSPPLNGVFADSFYSLGWLQSPAVAAGSTSAAEAATVMSGQAESGPAIEPSPIPGASLAANKRAKGSKSEATATETAPETKPEALTTASAAASSALSLSTGIAPAMETAPQTGLAGASSATGSSPGSEQLPTLPAATQSPVIETTPTAAEASPSASVAALASPTEQQPPVVAESSPASVASAPPIPSPATTFAPTHVASQQAPAQSPAAANSRQTNIIGGLLIGFAFFGALAVRMFRKPTSIPLPVFPQPAPADGPSVSSAPFTAQSAPTSIARNLIGGPRQVSLQLKASEPSVRRGILPSGKSPRGNGAVVPVTTTPLEPTISRVPEPAVAYPEPERVTEEPFTESVGPVIEETDESVGPVIEQHEPVVAAAPKVEEPEAQEAETPTPVELAIESANEAIAEPEVNEPLPELTVEPEPIAALAEQESQPISVEPVIESAMPSEPVIESVMPSESIIESAMPSESATEPSLEPVVQGQPVPYQVPVWPERTPIEAAVDTPMIETNIPEVSEPLTQKTTISETMPESIQIPTARPTVVPSPSPQPAGAMQTAVQLTFTFEIASMQLTSNFKMGALQVRPTSKIVSMRLAPSQQAQPGMNLQVTFEIAKIQPAGGALGSIRLTPSQQQRPTPTGSPSFTVAGLQLVPNFEAAPVQLTPSGSGASVFVTAPFQISTVEFSPSFEIASIALNSNSKHVLVQLPGPAPAGESAPMFEIANLQLTGGGDIGMMQLNLLQGRR
jgi:tetratricopeptide (TPR) repeat protein